MREIRPYGSEGGAARKGRSYLYRSARAGVVAALFRTLEFF